MTIASEISRLQWAKSDIKTAIQNRWVTIPASTKLDGFSTYIWQIPSVTSLATWTFLPLFYYSNSSKEKIDWASQCFLAKVWWYYVAFGRFWSLDYSPSRYSPYINLTFYYKQEWWTTWNRLSWRKSWPYDSIPPCSTFEAWFDWTKLYIHDYSSRAGSSSNNYRSRTPWASSLTDESWYSWSYNINNYTIWTASMYISSTNQWWSPTVSIQIIS